MTIKRRKVLGVGIGKTGTSTLGACMRKLGYHHLTWRRQLSQRILIEKDVVEMERLMEEYDSFDDTPWNFLYREMDERYPDTRFVLTLRSSPEVWFRSLKGHCERHMVDCPEYAFGTKRPVENPASAIATYERHNRDIREYFADRPGKLLEVCWETGDGWKELCDFLEEDVPDLPFPHANRRPRSMLKWRTKKMYRRYRNGLKRRLGL